MTRNAPVAVNATLVVGRVSTDLSPAEVNKLCTLIGNECNRLTASLAWQATVEPERRKLSDLLRRLEIIRQAQSQGQDRTNKHGGAR